ncbi:hypothetical protein FB451DRAFT_1570007 [Mycena latifolia]|nr:hypothetical protein FB451DRAFT_1570007 [Mycena latifolia]
MSAGRLAYQRCFAASVGPGPGQTALATAAIAAAERRPAAAAVPRRHAATSSAAPANPGSTPSRALLLAGTRGAAPAPTRSRSYSAAHPHAAPMPARRMSYPPPNANYPPLPQGAASRYTRRPCAPSSPPLRALLGTTASSHSPSGVPAILTPIARRRPSVLRRIASRHRPSPPTLSNHQTAILALIADAAAATSFCAYLHIYTSSRLHTSLLSSPPLHPAISNRTSIPPPYTSHRIPIPVHTLVL